MAGKIKTQDKGKGTSSGKTIKPKQASAPAVQNKDVIKKGFGKRGKDDPKVKGK